MTIASLIFADPDVAPGTSIGVQLLCAAGLVIGSVLVHGAGIVGATRLLGLNDKALRAHEVDIKAFGLLTAVALFLFMLHLIEITIFAVFYVAVEALRPLEAALYFSASSYTTLGGTDVLLPDDWRLVGAIEGLVGFLLIGWSTAVFITDMNKVLREKL